MTDSFITLDNVYQVALTLLSVDIDFIKPELKETLPLYVAELKKSIELYEKSLTMDFENLWENRMRDCIDELLKSTHRIFDALDDKGKNLLQNYMAMKDKNKNTELNTDI